MPAFTGDLEPGGCRFVGVRAFVLTRVHVSSEPRYKAAGLQMGNKTVAHFSLSLLFSLFRFFSFIFLILLLQQFPSPLRNACVAWNDNARASLRFEFWGKLRPWRRESVETVVLEKSVNRSVRGIVRKVSLAIFAELAKKEAIFTIYRISNLCKFPLYLPLRINFTVFTVWSIHLRDK